MVRRSTHASAPTSTPAARGEPAGAPCSPPPSYSVNLSRQRKPHPCPSYTHRHLFVVNDLALSIFDTVFIHALSCSSGIVRSHIRRGGQSHTGPDGSWLGCLELGDEDSENRRVLMANADRTVAERVNQHLTPLRFPDSPERAIIRLVQPWDASTESPWIPGR